MLSEELYIMDKNMERLMVAELQEKAASEKARADAAQAELAQAVSERDGAVVERDNAVTERDNAVIERDIYKLRSKNKNPEEIAAELQFSVEYVNSVLNS